jgi:hypothetical protein
VSFWWKKPNKTNTGRGKRTGKRKVREKRDKTSKK